MVEFTKPWGCHILGLCLGISKGMPSVKTFAPTNHLHSGRSLWKHRTATVVDYPQVYLITKFKPRPPLFHYAVCFNTPQPSMPSGPVELLFLLFRMAADISDVVSINVVLGSL